MVEEVYKRAADYDLEHRGEAMPDIPFWLELVRRCGARRVLELACGTGRITLELARAGSTEGYTVTGLELVPEMLAEAQRKLAGESPTVQAAIQLVEGDMRRLGDALPKGKGAFDLIALPYGSAYHLLTLEDQFDTWQGAYALLAPGGRFAVDLYPPNLAELLPPSGGAPLSLDREIDCGDGQTRLLRFKSTRYHPDEQLAEVRYIYERYQKSEMIQRYVSDFPMHVYFPRELHLLFLQAGFVVEGYYGSYTFDPFSAAATNMLVVGRRPGAA